MLILVSPYGIALIWHYTHFKRVPQMILTGIISLVFIVAVINKSPSDIVIVGEIVTYEELQEKINNKEEEIKEFEEDVILAADELENVEEEINTAAEELESVEIKLT